jgi:hypothetical protein
MKDAGLVENDRRYPNKAVADIKDEIEATAVRWYKIGAKRGALVVLEAILNGEFVIESDKDGNLEISTRLNEIFWRKPLNVTVGNEKRKVSKRKYKLTLKDLEFDI